MSAPTRLDALRSIGAPTLIVHGTEDPQFPFDHASLMPEAIPGARLLVWPGVGHELPLPLIEELAAAIAARTAAQPLIPPRCQVTDVREPNVLSRRSSK